MRELAKKTARGTNAEEEEITAETLNEARHFILFRFFQFRDCSTTSARGASISDVLCPPAYLPPTTSLTIDRAGKKCVNISGVASRKTENLKNSSFPHPLSALLLADDGN
jgi:hypothetical protein